MTADDHTMLLLRENAELRRQVEALQRLVDHPTRWSAEAIVGAMRLYANEHGRSPSAEAWRNAAPDRSRPAQHTVLKVFGSWAAALDAAGLPSNRSGRPRAASPYNGATSHA